MHAFVFGRSWRWLVVAGGVLLVGGCTERPATAPPRYVAELSRGLPAVSASAATGRSGTATIEVAAYLDGAGATHLTVTSFEGADLTTPAGAITKVQAKAYNGTKLVLADNAVGLTGGPVFTGTYSGLTAGFTLHIQANVVSVDGQRTDVVTAVAVVVAASNPVDLAVVQGSLAPLEFYVAMPTAFTAQVKNLLGTAATADCVLQVDGAEVARESAVSFPAGGAGTCQFAGVTMSSVGYHSFTVSVTNVSPADVNPANNAATATVAVDENPGSAATASWAGAVSDSTYLAFDSSKGYTAYYVGPAIPGLVPGGYVQTPATWIPADDSAPLLDYWYADHDKGRGQVSKLTVTLPRQIQFPIARLVLTQASGGTVLDSTVLTNLVPNNLISGAACVSDTSQAATTGISISLCSYSKGGYTQITYDREASADSLLSTGYNLLQSPTKRCSTTNDTTSYCHVITSNTATGTLAAIGSPLTFGVSLQVAHTTYGAQAAVPLAAFSDSASRFPTTASDVIFDDVKYLGDLLISSTIYHEVTYWRDYSKQNGLHAALSGEGTTSVTLP